MSSILRRAAGLGLAASCALAVAATPALAQEPPKPTDEQRAAALARPAVVYLETAYSGYVFDETGGLFNDGNPYQFTATCTGFVVNPDGYIATAGHCVDVGPEGARRELIAVVVTEIVAADPTIPVDEMTKFALLNYKTEGANPGTPIDRKVTVTTGAGTGNSLQGTTVTAEVVDLQSFNEGDVALLKIPTTDLQSVELAPDADVQQGTPVLSIGYPGNREAVIDPSLEPTFKDGQISSRTTTGAVPVYEVSAAVSPGMSGGPTVGMDGRVVGINSFGASEREAFNFIATAARLSDLLDRNNVTAELGPVDLIYREGLELYYEGEYSDAIAKFDEALGLSPDFRQAQEFKTNAVRARIEFGDAGIDPIWYFVGGGAALLIGGIVLVVVLFRRGRGRGPTPPAFGVPQFAQGASTGYPGSAPWGGPSAGMGGPQAPAGSGFPATPAGGYPMPTADASEGSSGITPTITKDCSRCGTPQATTARFCSSCGNTVS